MKMAQKKILPTNCFSYLLMNITNILKIQVKRNVRLQKQSFKNGILDHWDCWMLRSPTSGLSREVECVSGSGEVLNSSDIYDEYYVGVRPAMWINLEK